MLSYGIRSGDVELVNTLVDSGAMKRYENIFDNFSS